MHGRAGRQNSPMPVPRLAVHPDRIGDPGPGACRTSPRERESRVGTGGVGLMAAVGALPFFVPKTVNGGASHPLVVHAVVVLLPLAIIGTIGIALWPAMRRHFALAVLAVGVVGGLAVPVAVLSGENFRDRLGAAQIVRTHQAFAHKLLWWTFAFVIVLIVMVVLDLARRLGPVQASIPASDGGESYNGSGGGVATVSRTQTQT